MQFEHISFFPHIVIYNYNISDNRKLLYRFPFVISNVTNMAEITPRLFHLVYASTYFTGALQDKRV